MEVPLDFNKVYLRVRTRPLWLPCLTRQSVPLAGRPAARAGMARLCGMVALENAIVDVCPVGHELSQAALRSVPKMIPAPRRGLVCRRPDSTICQRHLGGRGAGGWRLAAGGGQNEHMLSTKFRSAVA